MRFLLDTVHISILQYPTEPDYSNLKARLVQHATRDIAYPIVSFHEQVLGAHDYINKSRKLAEIVRGYERLGWVLAHYSFVQVLPFDAAAASVFSSLATVRGRVGTMDLRIASIALSRGLTLLTRNTRDFGRVPNLITEDWTV
jgi:tRNA(fMet)-specific endonuclease VapC